MLLIFENDLKLQRIGKKRLNQDSSTIPTFLLGSSKYNQKGKGVVYPSTKYALGRSLPLFLRVFLGCTIQRKFSCLFTLFMSFYVPLLRRSQLDFENPFPPIVVSLFSCIMSVSALPFLRFQISLLVGKAQFVESLRTLRRQYYSI